MRRGKSEVRRFCHQAPYHGLGNQIAASSRSGATALRRGWRPARGSSARVSALRRVGERVIRIAGIHKIDTGFAQQSFDLLDRSPNYAARLAGLNLALQLEEAPIGAVETLRQDRCNVKERDRVALSRVAAWAT